MITMKYFVERNEHKKTIESVSSILPRVKLSIRGDVNEKHEHSTMLRPNVPVHVRDLFRAHLAVGTLKPRSLATPVPHVPSKIRHPCEPAGAIGAAEFLRLVRAMAR